MSKESYSAEIPVSTRPESVYRAITMELDQWWTESSDRAKHAGDPLTVRFEGDTSWRMTVIEALPNRSLVWKVIEANHDLEDLTRKDEWKGTTIRWKIMESTAGSTVSLVHEGLVPALECYETCEAGWDYFLGSLKNYLETGTGSPYR